MPLKEAMHVAIHMKMEHTIFESDSHMMVQEIHSNYGCNYESSVIISSINNLLALHSNFEVKFFKRQANLVTHLLAKVANSWTRRYVFHLIPPRIEKQLINDMI